MGFASLGSGSRGNGTVVALADTTFLVDCGFSLRQTERRLAHIGLSGGDIGAVFVTHEHADHIGGVGAFAHKYGVEVYASFGTLKSGRLSKSGQGGLEGVQLRPFDGDVEFEVEGVTVNPVRVPHDAREPTQFVFTDGIETIGVLSDLGCVTAHVVEQYQGCSHLILEANHDPAMLQQGRYPPQLKRRVGGDQGHLSNAQAVELLRQVGHPDLHVVIGHVSEQNNAVELLNALFAPLREEVASLSIATQAEGFAWIGRQPLIRQKSFAEVL